MSDHYYDRFAECEDCGLERRLYGGLCEECDAKCSPHFGQVMTMSNHNHLNWTDFLLSIGMELAFCKNPINEQLIVEKIQSLGGKL